MLFHKSKPPCFSERRLSTDSLNTNDITVFKEVFHMHRSGARMTNIQIGASGQVKRTSEINYFDFKQGAGYSSKQQIPFQIEAGDSFVTSCFFEKEGVKFGSGSDQEMCQIFLWYYPKATKVRTLSCGYEDINARWDAWLGGDKSYGSVLTPYGCEMGYDSYAVGKETYLERLSPTSSDDNLEEAQCQKPSYSGQRAASAFLIQSQKLYTWPTLVKYGIQFQNKSKSFLNSSSVISPKEQITEDCTLCRDGSKPNLPKKEIEGYESDGAETGWTCDEMDAFIPIMFSNPGLVYMNRDVIPPCSRFRDYFGRMCGCPNNGHNTTEVNHPNNTSGNMTHIGTTTGQMIALHHLNVIVLRIVILLIILSVFKRLRRCGVHPTGEETRDEVEMAPIL